MVEFPCQRPGENEVTFEQILDIGLCVLETVIIYGNELGFRPMLHHHLVGKRP